MPCYLNPTVNESKDMSLNSCNTKERYTGEYYDKNDQQQEQLCI